MLPLLLALALLLSALLLWSLRQNGSPALTEYEIAAPGLPESFDGFTIAQVSDLHNAVFGEGNEKLLRLLREAEPDIIAVTGDLIDSRHSDTDAALDFIRAAAETAPVFYVTGNHEARLDFDAIEPRLREAGARVLRGESVILSREGGSIAIAGIDDPALIGQEGSAAERAAAALEGLIDEETYTVLLAHRPELFDTYARYGANLTLCGHAHGGQIRLPLIGGVFAPGQGFFPEYDAGLYREGEALMLVSRGLGNSLFPLRVNNRPELVAATLRA